MDTQERFSEEQKTAAVEHAIDVMRRYTGTDRTAALQAEVEVFVRAADGSDQMSIAEGVLHEEAVKQLGPGFDAEFLALANTEKLVKAKIEELYASAGAAADSASLDQHLEELNEQLKVSRRKNFDALNEKLTADPLANPNIKTLAQLGRQSIDVKIPPPPPIAPPAAPPTA